MADYMAEQMISKNKKRFLAKPFESRIRMVRMVA
jgi:hypothetical protein